ncbi:MAG: protein-glutamate O-methyltransferase CheR [Sphingobium sp.]|nr:protein-glutamate O-methyltransferase CheR [Sphingobium sp.]MBP8670938.1 protein-glutamate O-methyltransferase CheR [Sphingobium sp.]MBP9158095.1 protein-glutamate O-methyltransferase CheR [Sphingobium sp.]MCC6481954.1 protein-glutamate O-methyltransferase CheR [Sphingomonadaceae bacterium]
MNQFTPVDRDSLWGVASLSDGEFREIAAMLHQEARISLTPQKATLVRSRLSRRLREQGLKSFSDYIALVRRDLAERRQMIELLTTNHTHFFREQHHFNHLHKEMVPFWRGRSAREPVRIWSAASSSGEEVYTIAMTLLGQDLREAQWVRSAGLQLFATDISEEMVKAVRKAEYPKGHLEQIPQPYRKLWTRDAKDGFAIAPEAGNLVTASQLNLFERWPWRHTFEAIFCRNVMIYFNEEAKTELEMRLVAQLAPGGALYIGHSERLLSKAKDFMIPCGHTMYRKPETMR